jgi:membrane protein
VKRFIALMKEAATAWSRNRAPRMAAAIAYYAIFALPPLVMLTIMVASLVFERAAARQQLLGIASDLVGTQAAQTLDQFLDNVPTPAGDWLSTIIGLGALLFSASAMFGQLQDSLNVLWGVHTARQGFKQMVLNRATHFLMVVLVGVLFILMIIFATTTSWLVGLLPPPIGGNSLIAQVIDILISLLFATIAFGVVYKVVPDVYISWRHAFWGALVTATLFLVGRLALSLFFRYTDPTSAYGAAGSLILLLLWIYYLGQIFFFGAEVTEVLTEWQGGMIKPAPGMLREASVMHPPGDVAEADVEGSPEVREALKSVAEMRRRDRDVPSGPEGLLGGILSTLSMMFLLVLFLIKFGRRGSGPGPDSSLRP